MNQALPGRSHDVLAMVSHECRNAVAPILGSLHILNCATAKAEQKERTLAAMTRQVAHLARLVDDLLDVTSIAHGKLQLRRSRIDLVDLVHHALEDHRPVLAKSGVTLDAVVPPQPVWVEADPVRLAQVLSNLLHNA